IERRADDVIGEQYKREEDCTDNIPAGGGDASDARIHKGRAQDGIGKMQVGGGDKGNANPFKAEPDVCSVETVTAEQKYLPDVHETDESEQRAECPLRRIAPTLWKEP